MLNFRSYVHPNLTRMKKCLFSLIADCLFPLKGRNDLLYHRLLIGELHQNVIIIVIIAMLRKIFPLYIKMELTR